LTPHPFAAGAVAAVAGVLPTMETAIAAVLTRQTSDLSTDYFPKDPGRFGTVSLGFDRCSATRRFDKRLNSLGKRRALLIGS
jgi:hypothetical protein